jgi:hypothetical protein
MSKSARYFAIFAAFWIVATTWKLYPQFQSMLRIEGHVVALDDFVEDACGERVGPLAASCHTTAVEKANRLLLAEQAKSLLLVEAPLILYAVLYVPTWLTRRRRS